jgi:hypothetical protein
VLMQLAAQQWSVTSTALNTVAAAASPHQRVHWVLEGSWPAAAAA